MTKKKAINFLPLIYAIFGIYFLNFGLGFLVIPAFAQGLSKWIVTFGGALFLVSAYRAVVYSKGRLLRRFAKEVH
ncbi:MAG: hypothetical protein PF542_06220 [Nanoarchaeota archaeon]|jgi:hypothetical protein|nr:hypothetical protein [Nanoarchaeota archaeon]